MRQQRRLYEAILTNTPDLAYVFDLQHRFIYANEGLLRMWGRTWDEAIGKTCLELGYEPWHAEMHDREIEEVLATRRPVRGEVPFNGTFGRRITTIFSCRCSGGGRPRRSRGRNNPRYFRTRSIHRRKAPLFLESERAARSEAERAGRMKDEFLATLSMNSGLHSTRSSATRRSCEWRHSVPRNFKTRRLPSAQCQIASPTDRRPARYEPHHFRQSTAYDRAVGAIVGRRRGARRPSCRRPKPKGSDFRSSSSRSSDRFAAMQGGFSRSFGTCSRTQLSSRPRGARFKLSFGKSILMSSSAWLIRERAFRPHSCPMCSIVSDRLIRARRGHPRRTRLGPGHRTALGRATRRNG